jgi:hypothetical protein
MSGSGASNLGYGEFPPNSNVDGSFVNKTSTNYPGFFTDTTIPSHGLKGAASNVMAAAGIAPCQLGGGSRKKNKSIHYRRKMRHQSKKMKVVRRKKFSRKWGGTKRGKTIRKYKTRGRRHFMRGGYDQYGNNVPYTPNYSTGGQLPFGLSALANPAPYHILTNGGSCPDNYNHYANPIKP